MTAMNMSSQMQTGTASISRITNFTSTALFVSTIQRTTSDVSKILSACRGEVTSWSCLMTISGAIPIGMLGSFISFTFSYNTGKIATPHFPLPLTWMYCSCTGSAKMSTTHVDGPKNDIVNSNFVTRNLQMCLVSSTQTWWCVAYTLFQLSHSGTQRSCSGLHKLVVERTTWKTLTGNITM